MSGLVCMSDRVEEQRCYECAYDPPVAHAFMRSVCMLVGLCLVRVCVFKCALECFSLPLWMHVSKILMRCQLDFSQLITGCTSSVSVSLTHSHMLFPVLIFQLGHVMLMSHSMHSLRLSFFLSLSPSVLSDVDHLPSLFVNLNFTS